MSTQGSRALHCTDSRALRPGRSRAVQRTETRSESRSLPCAARTRKSKRCRRLPARGMHDGHRRARALLLPAHSLRSYVKVNTIAGCTDLECVSLRSGAYTHPPTPASTPKRARTHALHAFARDAGSDGTRWNQPDANLRGRAAGDRANSADRVLPLTARRCGRRGHHCRTDSKMVARHYCQVGGLPPLRQTDRRRRTARRSPHRSDAETQAGRDPRAVPFSARHALSLSEVAHVHTHSHVHTHACTRVDSSGTGCICLSYRAARDLCFLI